MVIIDDPFRDKGVADHSEQEPGDNKDANANPDPGSG
jgi:hypothetical protein